MLTVEWLCESVHLSTDACYAPFWNGTISAGSPPTRSSLVTPCQHPSESCYLGAFLARILPVFHAKKKPVLHSRSLSPWKEFCEKDLADVNVTCVSSSLAILSVSRVPVHTSFPVDCSYLHVKYAFVLIHKNMDT